MLKMKVFLLLISVIFTSCISNKKIVLLQDKTQKRPQDAVIDHSFEMINKDFVLEADDIISVNINHIQLSVTNETSLEGTTEIRRLNSMMHPYIYGFTIQSNDTISLPMLGNLKLGGLTLEEAQDIITQTAVDIYSVPVVSVYLLNNTISVLGEVKRPGTYSVYENKISIFNAVSEAGGFKDYANRNKVKILRTRGGENRIFFVDLTDEKLLLTENLFLQPNDVILVQPLKRKKFTTNDNQQIYRILSLAISAFTLYALLHK